MIKWEYTFYVSNIRSVGIKDIPTIDDLWDENGYRLGGEKPQKSPKNRKYEGEEDLLNSFGQKGWELVSITPISFLVNRGDLGKTTELMLTFKKLVE